MLRGFEVRHNHGLSFIAVFAFVFSFFGSRLFATLNPTVVVETGGIHFHHFLVWPGDGQRLWLARNNCKKREIRPLVCSYLRSGRRFHWRRDWSSPNLRQLPIRTHVPVLHWGTLLHLPNQSCSSLRKTVGKRPLRHQ